MSLNLSSTTNSSSNYIVLDNGLIINWGFVTNTSGSLITHAFSYPYSTTPAVTCTGDMCGNSFTVGRCITIGSVSTSSFTTKVYGTNGSDFGTYTRWIAIGY